MFTSEHLHVALNHIALIGFAVAIIPLLVALIRKDRGALLSALLIVFLCGLSIPVVMETGDGAAVRLATGDAGVQLDSAAGMFLHEHEERADVAATFVYISMGLAAAGLVTMRIKPQHQYKLAVLVLAGCVVCTALLVWTAEAGGQIRHPEFRPTVTTPAQ
jgi:peptidoglycan/LPS O-acetylase OafA/YrhL